MSTTTRALTFSVLVITAASASAQSTDLQRKLQATFEQVTKAYPADSASLYRFYFKTFAARDSQTVQKQILRLQGLLSDTTQKTYHAVQTQLKPLMQAMLSSKTISHSQVYRFVALYSAYDRYRWESLFSKLLAEEDNYQLVHKTMRRLAAEATRDTSCIAALISLNQSIRTNVELAEGMGDLLTQAIRNNPTGFLQMYLARDESARKIFARNLLLYEGSLEEIRPFIHKAAASSVDERLRKAEQELMRFAKEQQ